MAKRFFEMSPEELSEAGRKGGIASGEAKRRKKAMRESLNALLTMPLQSGKFADLDSIKNFAALKGKNITVEQAMLVAQIQKALRGDTAALQFLRDTSGQKPEDNVNMTATVTENPYDQLSVEELRALANVAEETESD